MNFHNVAANAIHQASKKILEMSSQKINYSYKDEIDIQAEADVVSENIIKEAIKKHFPDHGILAEESSPEKIDSEYVWVIDPIDGAMNFSRRQDDFAISVALLRNSECILGLIYQPTLGRMYSAEKGKGAFLNDKSISVSTEVEVKRMILEGNDPKTFEYRKKSIQILHSIHDKFRSVRMTHRAALRLCELATGRIDVAYSNFLNYWDMAAGILIVQEAGGTMTDFTGKSINMFSENYIGTSSVDHDLIVKMVSQETE